MPETLIADLTHFLDETGSIALSKGPAYQLAKHLTSIVAMISHPDPIIPSEYLVRCRRRPGRKPCTGFIDGDLIPDTEDIEWWCPVCEDNGYIRNWKKTMWDLSEYGITN